MENQGIKKTATASVILVALVAFAYLISPQRSAVPSTDKSVLYQCADGKMMLATYHLADDSKIDVSLSDGRDYALPHAISASGARYANSDESVVFWNKGTTAFLTEGPDQKQTYSDCSEIR